MGSWHPGSAWCVRFTITRPSSIGPGLLGGAAALPGLLLLDSADGGPQLGVGIPQHVLLSGLVLQRPAGVPGLPVQPLPALLAALQLPAQGGQPFLGLVQLCPQPLGLGRSVRL